MRNNNYITTWMRSLFTLLLISGSFVSWSQTFTIGTGVSENSSSGYSCPYGQYYTDGRQSFLYTPAELASAGMTSGMTVTQVGFNVPTNLNGSGVHPAFTITMANTALSSFATGSFIAGGTVYGPVNYTPVTGWNMHTLSSTFAYTGGGIIVTVCWQNASSFVYTNNASVQYTTVSNCAIDYHSDTDPAACSAAAGNLNSLRSNIRLVATGGSPCTGTPAPGNTISSINPVCSGASFMLSLQNSTAGSGVTYQWSKDTGGGYSPIGGATNATLSTTQAVATSYKCAVTCSGNTGTSNALAVGAQSGFSCLTYCTPTTGTPCAYMWLTNVTTTGGITNINNPSGCSAGGYGDFTATQTITGDAGSSFNISAAGNNVYGQGFAVWIDWNQNGLFTDAGENVFNAASTSPETWSGTIAIPPGATIGSTRMRVRSDYGSTPSSPCGAISYGETEDYKVTVTTPTACTGTPTPGNTVSSAGSSVCPSTNFTLSLQNQPTT
ncbi:MAG: GEVED domain-containing protein, partial [Bacteroidota bacterium]